jgi:hypothetical protein
MRPPVPVPVDAPDAGVVPPAEVVAPAGSLAPPEEGPAALPIEPP